MFRINEWEEEQMMEMVYIYVAMKFLEGKQQTKGQKVVRYQLRCISRIWRQRMLELFCAELWKASEEQHTSHPHTRVKPNISPLYMLDLPLCTQISGHSTNNL